MYKVPGKPFFCFVLSWLLVAGMMLFLLVSCRRGNSKTAITSNWTEAQKRNYFADSFAYVTGSGRCWSCSAKDSARSFGMFLKSQYPDLHSSYYMDPLPYALEEEYIDTTRIDSTREWVRFIVYSFFDLPYSLVLERKAGRSFLITKLADGRGLYHTGRLILTSKQEVPDSLTNAVFKTLDSLGFYHVGRDTSCHGGTDGSEWSIEMMVGGKYNRVERWEPAFCGDSVSRRLGLLGKELGIVCDLTTLVRACNKRRPGLIFKGQ